MPTPISSKTWGTLLDDSIKNSQYIVKDNEGRFTLVDKNSEILNKVQKLSLKEILEISQMFGREISPQARQIGLSLKSIANNTETKHYSGIRIITKLFQALVSGKENKYQTLTGRINSFAKRLIKSQTRNINDVPIQYYQKKSQHKTDQTKKTPKVFLGKGLYGSVTVDKDDTGIAVKKSEKNISRDFLIGAQLDHPNIVKMKGLYIKEQNPTEDGGTYKILKYKVFMEKLEGKTFYRIGEEGFLDQNGISKLLEETKSIMIHLFEKKISWLDIHSNNILLTPDKSLKICDLGSWKEETSNIELTKHLLVGAMEVVPTIIQASTKYKAAHEKFETLRDQLNSYSTVSSHDKKIYEAEKRKMLKMMYPPKLFGKLIPKGFVKTDHYNIKAFDKVDWMKPLAAKIQKIGNNEKKLKEFLSKYIDAVIEGLKE